MAEFVPASVDRAKKFLTKHHWGVLTTRRKDGRPANVADNTGTGCRGPSHHQQPRDRIQGQQPAARSARRSLRLYGRPFTAEAGSKSMATAEIISLPDAMDSLVYLQRQVYGEHKSWPEFHERMVRERRVIIRFAIESVAPLRRG